MKIVPCAVTVLTLALAGCGGGGGSSSNTPVTPALSDAQKNFESMGLAANGGLHELDGYLSISSSSTGALTVNPGSYFFTYDYSIPLTAANQTQPMTLTYSTASTLSLPTFGPAPRYLINSAVYSGAVPVQDSVSYTGGNVRTDHYAADGKTVINSTIEISSTVVGLTGLIKNSPAELFTNSYLGLITNTLNGASLYNQQASWQAGSTYLKSVKQSVGDRLYVSDCVLPVTTGPNLTPCSTTISALENFFPHVSADALTYQLGDGQIVTLGGVRAWVANAPLKASATTEYRVYYQNNGVIYRGTLIKDGTQLQVQSIGGVVQNFTLYMNSAAMQSIKSAVIF
ncbi:MAG: hypothetical protein ABI171_16435 [Collimonas sp.]|uniref:hypothetical protein n=1 Tax=Collimonas sp. TaxID=1963772 RepID=UPI00326768DB